MKLIAVSLSSNCIKEPRCSFCYQNKEHIIVDSFSINDAIRKLREVYPEATVSFEYSGYNLGYILMDFNPISYSEKKPKANITMTTMPQAVTPVFCSAVAKEGITAIALSYDSEKVSCPKEWVEKARMIKKQGMKVSCNFLLEFPDKVSEVPKVILKTADQLNLLALKPDGKVKNKTAIEVLINYCKGYLPVALDNCLAYQLGYAKDCRAGIDFCHVRPDGKIVDCCFQGDCFLWLKKNAESIAELALDNKTISLEVEDYLERAKKRRVS